VSTAQRSDLVNEDGVIISLTWRMSGRLELGGTVMMIGWRWIEVAEVKKVTDGIRAMGPTTWTLCLSERVMDRIRLM